MLQKMLWLGLAGALGTLSRYGLAGLVQKFTGGSFPWGTATVNIVGCLLFGILWAATETRVSVSGQMRMIIFVGFFGAFTTFSTFIFETGQLLDQSQWFRCAGNMLLQNVTGLGSLLGGLMVGRWI
jgi:CrcB protein